MVALSGQQEAITCWHYFFIATQNNRKMQKEIEIETWKVIPRCNGFYQASTLGRIKVLPHIRKYKIKGRILKLTKTPEGHLGCSIFLNRASRSISVQILMAITYMDYIPKKGFVVDHKDFDPSNNRLDNLQIITHRKNLSKDKFRGSHSSPFVGVCWHKRDNKWIANIRINNKLVHLGYFENEVDASNAYQKALANIREC